MDNLIEFLYSKFLQSDGVSIDTRTLEKDNLFFGLSGGNVNGSKYAKMALEKGASFAVIDDPNFHLKEGTILVENALKALQELAIFHRSRFKRPVFALTGSNGKTTTKELLSRVLAKKHIIHTTEGNYNNHIGVPLTILGIHPQTEIAVIEMGANHVGEIAQLCEFAKPTHGLITNIGRAHTETFGGIEGVLRGKSELFDFLRRNGGTAFINQRDERLKHMTKRFNDPRTYPEQDVAITKTNPFLLIEISGQIFETHLIGEHNFENVAAAISVGRYFGVEDPDIINAICSYEPDNMRAQVIQKSGKTIVLDAYNANPDSMEASIRSFAEMEGEKLAILGDMNELEDPREQHLKIGELLKSKGLKAFLLGDQMRIVENSWEGIKWFRSKEELRQYCSENPITEPNVLIKASRSLELETLVDLF